MFLNNILNLHFVVTALALALSSTALAQRTTPRPSAVTKAPGGDHSGGGIYGKHQGRWMLIDDLEQGEAFNPDRPGMYPALHAEVQAILRSVDARVPGFANELRKQFAKSWHIVDYELTCEPSDTKADVEKIAGACSTIYDVWISRGEFLNAGTIIHELIQGVRLAYNRKADNKYKITADEVRVIKRAISGQSPKTDVELQKLLRDAAFGQYATAADAKVVRQSELNFVARVCLNRDFTNPAQSRDASELAQVLIGQFYVISSDARTPEGLDVEYYNLAEKLHFEENAGTATAAYCRKLR